MPSSLPAGITVATATFGKRYGALGTQAVIKAKVSFDRTLVWAATGDILDDFPDPIESGVGGFLSFPFPHTDQEGFEDGSGNTITDFAGVIEAQVFYNTKLYATVKKPFQIATGVTSFDIDLVPNGSITLPVEAPSPKVTSVIGETGEVTAEQLVAAFNAAGYVPGDKVLNEAEDDFTEPAKSLLSATNAAALVAATGRTIVGTGQQFAPIPRATSAPCIVTKVNNVPSWGAGVTALPGGTARAPAAGFACSYAPNDLTRLTYYGSAPVVNAGAGYPDNLNAYFDYVMPGGTNKTFGFIAETLHTGRYVEFQIKQFSGAVYWIWVDGQPLTVKPQSLGGTAGSTGSLVLDFGASGVRKIQVRASGCRFYGINVDPASRCVATVRNGPRVAVVCDSGGGGAQGVTSISTFVHLLGEHLGTSDVWNLSSGGSGYLSAGFDGTARTRLPGVTAISPDIVFVMMGHNDSGFTTAAVGVETDLYLDAMRTALPDAQIIVASPWHQGTNPAGYAAMTEAIFAAAEPYADHLLDVNTYYPFSAENIPLYISAVDNVHPTQDGHFYWAWWLALRLRPLLLASRTGEVAPPPVLAGVPFSDTFDRADSTTTLGSYWSALSGTWGIGTNKAYAVTGASHNFVTHDAETPDVTMTVTVGGSSGGQMGLCFRVTSTGNCYALNFNAGANITVQKVVSGTFTTVGTVAGFAATSDVMTLTCKGSQITVKKNGSTVLDFADSTWLTATQHGLYSNGSQPAATRAWDTFTMVAS